MTGITASAGMILEPFSYDDFQGLNTSRDIASLDTQQKQHLHILNNGYASFSGLMIRDRGADFRTTTPGDRLIKHVTFFGSNLIAWAQEDGGGTTLRAEPNGIEAKEVFPKSAIVSSTVFNNKLIFTSRDQIMQHYDGLTFKPASNIVQKPAFAVAIQRRLAIAGMAGRKQIIDFSRVDDPNVFTEDEQKTETSVTKAADIDIRNIIGSSDEIKGLGVFETNNLAVFTKDQALVYSISPDFTKWIINDKAAVGHGTISHNSIANVGTDLYFASRSGIHSLRRSDVNGVTISALPLSSKIEETYKSLLRLVPNHEDISAYYDQDNAQYHVFMPQSEILSTRLTLTLNPVGGENKWSTGTFLNQRCGATLGGVTVVGTRGGIFEMKDFEDTAQQVPDLDIVTPILWHGSLTETKNAKQFIIQASGQGQLEIDAYNNENKLITSFKIDLDAPTPPVYDEYQFLPLSNQYNRPFVCQYKGVKFRIRARGGTGRIKIIGFAVLVEAPKRRTRNE